jgi:hypothetical protein
MEKTNKHIHTDTKPGNLDNNNNSISTIAPAIVGREIHTYVHILLLLLLLLLIN